MSTSTSHSGAIDGYEPVHVRTHVARVRADTATFRRRSVQPTRRALLHLQAAGEPVVASDLVSWYTERAFHFYTAGLRLPGTAPLPARNPARRLSAAFADLDAACAHLRATDGIESVVVMASGRSAAAVALWSDARQQAADALILHSPEFAARPALSLNIACPVLVLTSHRPPSGRAPAGGRLRRRRLEATAISLGEHVTSLQLAPDSGPDSTGGPAYFDALGRWLGAYMYGQGRDRLL
ncbi:MAG: hypothetical protein ACLQFR_12295 [Streptosporangiaceae bacterium]